MTSLPIEPVLATVRDTLADHRSLVLQAPPGAGKTTRVPLILLGADWLGDRSIIMLEPRRLATRAAAEWIARLAGERVGETIGYRMRGESRVGPRTRIEVVTEGILARRLQRDPTLDGVGVVIFDEFHERSLDADLGLALTLRTQELVREDLRIIAMSATLDCEAVARRQASKGEQTKAWQRRDLFVAFYEARQGETKLREFRVVCAHSAHRDEADAFHRWLRVES